MSRDDDPPPSGHKRPPNASETHDLVADATQVLATTWQDKCAYRTGKCHVIKATKVNGTRHRMCQFHRDKANLNQKRFDLKKKRTPGRSWTPWPAHRADLYHGSSSSSSSDGVSRSSGWPPPLPLPLPPPSPQSRRSWARRRVIRTTHASLAQRAARGVAPRTKIVEHEIHVPLHMYYPPPPTSTCRDGYSQHPWDRHHHHDAEYSTDLPMLPRDELQILVQLMWSEEEWPKTRRHSRTSEESESNQQDSPHC